MTLATHKQLAELMVAAYKAPLSVDAGWDARAVFTTIGTEFIVSIPGTVTLPGWLRDFSAWPANDDVIGYCHAGFLSNARRLWAGLCVHVETANAAGMTVTYAGHSLGGPEAEACISWHMSRIVGPKPRLITWGCPRMALGSNVALRNMLEKAAEVTRYKRAGDPVPHVPNAPIYLHSSPVTVVGAVLPGSNIKFIFDPVNDKNHGIVHYAADMKD